MNVKRGERICEWRGWRKAKDDEQPFFYIKREPYPKQ
jgi:hypothetical protein